MDPIQQAVQDKYGALARSLEKGACCESFGCGNPVEPARLEPGQTVLDLGSGPGLDVLRSAKRVGPTGKVYGESHGTFASAFVRARKPHA